MAQSLRNSVYRTLIPTVFWFRYLMLCLAPQPGFRGNQACFIQQVLNFLSQLYCVEPGFSRSVCWFPLAVMMGVLSGYCRYPFLVSLRADPCTLNPKP